jgi:glycerol-3-phosphate dehydrogenase (NAD(P)+)
VGQTVEGIPTTYALHDLSRKLGVEMPVTQAVYEVLENGVNPAAGVRSLMGREATSEHESQDILTLIAQIRQTASKTARRTARRLLP